MLKMKRGSSKFKTKIDKKLFFGTIIFTFLLCLFAVYAYASPNINKTHYSIQFYFEQLFWPWLHPDETQLQYYAPTPFYSHSLNPTYFNIPPLSVPPTPQPTPIELPNQNFNKLIVYRTRYTHEDTALFTKVITDQTTIKKLYNDIKNSDFWKPGVYHCPMDNGIEYVLNFYSNDVLTVHSILNVTGCRGIRFTKYTTRRASSPLIEDLKQTLDLSMQEFYGY